MQTVALYLCYIQFNSEHEVKRCNRPNCGLRSYLFEGTAFGFNCGRKFFVHNTKTCEVKNDLRHEIQRLRRRVYRQNRKSLIRVTFHNQQIRDPRTRMLHVSEHISICANLQDQKYYIFPFHKCILKARH